MYNNINELLNPTQQEAFCKEVGAEELDIWNNHVIATTDEVTECYYGHRLIQPVIVGEYSFSDIEAWKELQCEKDMIERICEGGC